ncbi:MAG: hypothetical protein EHM49_02020 [Deltaproteobacteria bacterium]|nr:MAG: hypothetical protein EHM49_02020 [Deltaproteobacteria bacterium]
MIRPDERVNKSIVALTGNGNWEIVKKWIEDSFWAQAADHALDVVSDERKDLIKKGQALELSLLKNHIARAKDVLQKAGK